MVLCGALGPAWSPGAPRHFAWQAWHLVTFTFVSRGRRGTHGTVWRAWSGLVARGAAALCVAGVALGDIHLHFAWQAWHLVTSSVAGVALMVLCGALGPAWSPGAPRHFAWQAWHLVTFTVVSRGRRGTNSHPPSFCVPGVGQMALGGALGPAWSPGAPRHFAWQPWHLVTFTVVSRGRRGTNSHPPSFCVAGVGQMALGGALGPAWSPGAPRHFAWQPWHLVTSTLISPGRRGTIAHPRSFCVAGVAPALTHPLSHTTLSHTIFHTQLCHPPSFTHHLSHTTLSPTIFDTLFYTPSL